MSVSGPVLAPTTWATDADWRLWAQAIHDRLVAAGLIQTADTGQINLATAVRPATTQAAGYEIFRFNDSLQATAPIFIKVEYGSGTATSRGGIYITVGTGTNGAGTLSGILFARTNQYLSNAPAITPAYTLASGDGSRIWMLAGQDWTTDNKALGFLVERTRDANGVPTADGIFVWTTVDGTLYNWRLISYDGTVSVGATTWPIISPNVASSKGGTDLAFSPCILFLKGKPVYVMPLCGTGVADFPAGTSFTVNYLGADRTYLAEGIVIGTAMFLGANTGVLCFPWE